MNRRIGRTVAELIGMTPVLMLQSRREDCRAVLKLEGFNPGSSVKDRAALSMIREAERRGELRPGSVILESSSGNTGVALAMVGAVRGYEVIIVVDNHVQPEKIGLMKAYGARVEHVGRDLPEEEQAGAEREAKIKEIMASRHSVFYVNQGDNLDNRAAHYNTTAVELLDQVGRVDMLVATIGTGGSISGTARRLREENPNIIVHGLEPDGSVFFGNPYKPFLMTGAGSTKEIWKNIDFEQITKNDTISDRAAFNACRFFARHFGLLVGGTGGVVLYKITQLLSQPETTGTIVGIIPDRGDQYLTTIYDDGWMTKHNLMCPVTTEMMSRAFADGA